MLIHLNGAQISAGHRQDGPRDIFRHFGRGADPFDRVQRNDLSPQSPLDMEPIPLQIVNGKNQTVKTVKQENQGNGENKQSDQEQKELQSDIRFIELAEKPDFKEDQQPADSGQK